jgi:hypothetical protein
VTFSYVERPGAMALPEDEQRRHGVDMAAQRAPERIALASVIAILALSACVSSPSPMPSTAGPSIVGPVPQVICDPAPVPPVPLMCDAAITEAMAALSQGPWAIETLHFHYGSYCAPDAPCASSFPNVGYVEVRLRGQAAEVAVSVEATADGVVVGSSPAPYPP